MTYQFPDSVMLIFCKAPIAGQVKTRLQPELTAEEAVAAHIKLTQMTLARTFQKRLCPVVLCCSPDSEHAFFQQCAKDYPLTLSRQHGIDLGERMHNALKDALSMYRHAVLMGCDCPSLTVNDLEQALLILHTDSDVVIAPAEDGGYVLIGLNTPQPNLFNDMTWGTDSVMAETRHHAKEMGLMLHELEPQWDVDSIADWTRYLCAQNA
ncbi:TIGR04282 family arsenosugar biosynthesis glycosyltransferase [Methylomonas sp. BW4-1]|uniref:TIGR04282 family arsenosugar biosynthesis glycosyltransferase n=1 Tax=Methylomonas sp. BW4-1 TaxID=3376685 RepID=UPI0040427508